MARRGSRTLAWIGIALIAAAPAAASADDVGIWLEQPVNPDVGNLPETADTITGNMRLGRIKGVLGGGQDMFRISIPEPPDFVATVECAVANIHCDPQLFVFDAFGQLVASDDDSGPSIDAEIKGFPREGGQFFLAISENDDDPVLTNGAVTGWTGALKDVSCRNSPAAFCTYEIVLKGAYTADHDSR